MEHELEDMIEQISFRVRLFTESTGKGQSAERVGERELIFLEYLEKKRDVNFSELTIFFKKVSASTVSNTLKKLYEKGLVARKDEPKDLRSKVFSITEDGRRFLEPVKRDQAEVSKVIADFLKLTPEEAKVVAGIIPRAIRNFDSWLGLTD